MDDASALLDAIVHEPDDDLPRLAYADWCEENGLDARAEFIRVQLELADDACAGERRKALLRREKSLLAGNERRWAKPFKPRLSKLVYRRGFVERASADALDFLAKPREMMTCAPIRGLTLRQAGTLAPHLAGCEMLGWLEALGLPGAGAEAASLILKSPHLGRLTCLDLERNGLDVQRLSVLPAGPLGRLRTLYLDGNEVDAGLAALLARHAPHLEELSVVRTALNGAELRAIAALPGLRVVWVDPLRAAHVARLREEYPHIDWRIGRRPEGGG